MPTNGRRLAPSLPPTPTDSHRWPGAMLYFMPLGTGVSKRKPQSWRHTGWSTPFGDFWCCQGTGVEAFARLAEHIFMERRAGVAPTTALDDVAPATALPELFVLQVMATDGD